MTLDKVSFSTIEKWLKCGAIAGIDDHLYVMSTADHCRAIENIKKSGIASTNLSSNCDDICNTVQAFELSKQNLIAALYDECFCESHLSRNQNGLSIASYVSLYYQEWYPEEKETFTQDIEF